jgi:murein DD-endopeptidase MepM/ murein hydrolase activator NlpD
MTRRAIAVLGFCLTLVCPPRSRGHAESATLVALGPSKLTSGSLRDAERSFSKYRRDASGKPAYLARFSDGPRNVPRARGAAKLRAERLQLGTLDSARDFLRSRPAAEALAEVKSDAPRTLLWPVVGGHWGRGFGYTRRVRPELRHNGIDIGAKAGTVVRAAADGLVVYSDNGLLGYGNCVMILHQNGWLTLYAHNLRTTVQAGWRVKRGERIGLVGQTGYAWGPHLHFELRDNGRLRDPKPLLTGYKSVEVNGPLVTLDTGLEPDEPTLSDELDEHAHEPHEAHDAHDAHDADKSAPTSVQVAAVVAKPSVVNPVRGSEAPRDPHFAYYAQPARENEAESRLETAPAKTVASNAKPVSAPPPSAASDDDSTVPAPPALPDVTRLLRAAASAEEKALAGERIFRNLLWPVKGGVVREGYSAKRPALLIDAELNAGVRAAADGIVLHAGSGLPGYGDVVVLLHGNGWVTLYDGARDIAVKAGDHVLRGQWIGRVGSGNASEAAATARLRFEWRDAGTRRDPAAVLIGAPQEP